MFGSHNYEQKYHPKPHFLCSLHIILPIFPIHSAHFRFLQRRWIDQIGLNSVGINFPMIRCIIFQLYPHFPNITHFMPINYFRTLGNSGPHDCSCSSSMCARYCSHNLLFPPPILTLFDNLLGKNIPVHHLRSTHSNPQDINRLSFGGGGTSAMLLVTMENVLMRTIDPYYINIF